MHGNHPGVVPSARSSVLVQNRRLDRHPDAEQIRAYLKTRPNAKLSMAALETLAVIAYKQPVTLAEILAIRGKKSSTALQTLLERKLVAILGRKPVVGRPNRWL